MVLCGMKLLIAFIVVFVIIFNAFQYDHHAADHSSRYDRVPNPSDDDLSKYDALLTEDRLPRAPPVDGLKDTVDKMQMIARLTNVLYLQQGLSNGSVFKSDELISELLQFGSVKPKDIKALNLEVIKNALEALKTLPSSLESNVELTDLEKMFLSLGKVLDELRGRDTVKNWEGREDFEEDMEELKTDGLDLGHLNKLQTLLNDWGAISRMVLGLQAQASFNSGDYRDLNRLKEKSSEVKNATESLKKKLYEFRNGPTADEALALFSQLYQGNLDLDSIHPWKTLPEDFKILESNVNKINGTVTQLTQILPQLQTIRTLFYTRFHPGVLAHYITYTPGMPNGYADVGKVADAFHNEWFKEVVNASLRKSYPAVELLGSGMSTIQMSLGPESGQVQVFTDILKELERIKEYNNFPLTDAKKIAKCFESVTNGLNRTIHSVDLFVNLATQIDDELRRLGDIVKLAGDQLTAQKINLDSLIETMNKANKSDPESINTAFKELFGPKLTQLEQVQAAFRKIELSELRDDNLKSLATKSLTEMNKIDDYESSTGKNYGHLDCFLGIKSKTSKVISGFAISKHLRESFQVDADKGFEFTKAVHNIKDGLQTLKDAIMSGAGYVNTEAKLLVKLNSLDIKTMGLATRGISNMMGLLDRKSEFNALRDHSTLIKDTTDKYSKEFNPDEKALLTNLTTLGASLDAMFAGLKNWGWSAYGTDWASLEEYSNIFTTAKDVAGLKESIGNMTKVLDKLIILVEKDETKTSRKRSTKELKDIQEALITLDTLEFSKYTSYYDQVGKTLKFFDSFFADEKLPPVVLSIRPPPEKSRVTPPKKFDVELFLIVFLVSFALAIGAGYAYIVYLICSKKDRSGDPPNMY